MIGHRIRIGRAKFEVLRPIDRCKATSIDPSTGLTDLNIPALLALQEGHMFCGIHTRVVKPGLVRVGDLIEDLGPVSDPFSAGASNPAAPPVAKWPRYAEVVARVDKAAPPSVSGCATRLRWLVVGPNQASIFVFTYRSRVKSLRGDLTLSPGLMATSCASLSRPRIA